MTVPMADHYEVRRERDWLWKLLRRLMAERSKWAEPQPLPERLEREIRSALRGGSLPPTGKE